MKPTPFQRASSNRKPHNGDAGYIAEKIYRPTGAHVVIYVAEAQGMDVDGNRYAVVCSKHSTICGVRSVPKARVLMKYPEFCERCMAEERSTPNSVLGDGVAEAVIVREALKGCPFCGSLPTISELRYINTGRLYGYWLKCGGCGLDMKEAPGCWPAGKENEEMREAKVALVARWNCRQPNTALSPHASANHYPATSNH